MNAYLWTFTAALDVGRVVGLCLYIIVYAVRQDAHEFLCQVLDQLKEEVIGLNKKAEGSPHANGNPRDLPCRPEDSPSATASTYINPTMLNFELEVLHTITCLE